MVQFSDAIWKPDVFMKVFKCFSQNGSYFDNLNTDPVRQGNQVTDTHTCAPPPTAWCRPRPWKRCGWRTRPTNCLPAKPNLEVGSESSHLEHLRAGRGVDPVVAAWLVTLHFAVPDLWPLELPQALELMLLEIVEVLPLLKVTWVWVNLLTEDF